MNIDWSTDLYCLIGHPISKSLSPKIHNYIFSENKTNGIYLCFDVKEKSLETVISSFKALNIKGFNVTIPYKIEIMKYLDDIDREAEMLGAVNTVKNFDGRLIGYNTDGIGFLKSLKNKGIEITNKTFLILGAGGASSAISTRLAIEGAKKIIILNRDLNKAKKIACKIEDNFRDVLVNYGPYNFIDFNFDEVNIIVNCTSVGMYPNIDFVPIDLNLFRKKVLVYDVVYKPLKTKFLKMAEDKGFATMSGISMLINQAIASQQIWYGDNNFKFDVIEKRLEGFLYNNVE